RGFSHAEIARMIQFAQTFPTEEIVVTLSQQLSWSHFHALLPIKDPLARAYRRVPDSTAGQENARGQATRVLPLECTGADQSHARKEGLQEGIEAMRATQAQLLSHRQ